jgi:hypothetical protein
MSESIHELIEQQHAFYEVMPYYIVLRELPHGAKATTRKIQAGFDVDIYLSKASLEPTPSPDYALVYTALQKVAEMILRHASDSCSIEVIPFGSTVFLDTRKHVQPEAMLRITITHGRGLDQPAGALEERALKEVEENLHVLGVGAGRGAG